MNGQTSKTKPKWRRRADARPDEVLDASLDLFIASGFSATRVEDIARRAGISKGAVYLYFESKEAILTALVRRSVVPVAEDAVSMSALEHADPAETIRLMVKTVAGRMADGRIFAIPRIIIAEAGNFPELVQMYRREVIERGLGALEALVRRGIEQGQFRPVVPVHAVRSIIGPLIAHLLLWRVFGFEDETDVNMETFVESHLDLLFHGLAHTNREMRT